MIRSILNYSLIAASALFASDPAKDSATSVIFVASTPCDPAIRAFNQIPLNIDCDKVSWKMTFHGYDGKIKSGEVAFGNSWGFHITNQTFETRGGNENLSGTWDLRSSGNKKILTVKIPNSALQFLELSENLIHPLDGHGKLMSGNSGWSYTLSRTDPVQEETRITATEKTASLTTTQPAQQFWGRTPCRELAKKLGITSPDCFKLKWKLLLFADVNTGLPDHYELARTEHRQSVIKGNWSMQLAGHDTLYALDPGTEKSLKFLKVDEDVLLFVSDEGRLLAGNSEFSYTLNRSEVGASSLTKKK